MISLNYPAFLALNQFLQSQANINENNCGNFSNHQSRWKNTLNNLRLIIQQLFLFWLIYPWLDIFPNSHLLLGFNHLISAMNQFKPIYSSA